MKSWRPLAASLLVTGLAALALVAATPASFPVIVVFHDGAVGSSIPAAVQAYEHGLGFRAQHVYQHALNGFAARLTAAQIVALEDDPAVAYVEEDKPMSIVAQTLPWGIDRIDADISSTLAGNGSGAVTNVNVFVIDTGVQTNHPDINVVRHVNFAGGPNRDCHGHGTHVAGTIAARDNDSHVVGVVPGAPVTGVKVLNCSGSGSTSGVIAGVDWVTANRTLPAVANMSLGGSASTALDNAVRNSVASGVFYAVAAGNSNVDACTTSPARAGQGDNGIMTARASDINDNKASFSNFGPCTDIDAPGVSILSTWTNSGTATASGTSMSSPHVAGTAALFLSSNTGASPTSVEIRLKADGDASRGTAPGPIVYAGRY